MSDTNKQTKKESPTLAKSTKKIWREIFFSYGITIGGIIFFVVVSRFVPLLHSYLLGIVTLIFIFVARHFVSLDPDPDRFHLYDTHIFRDSAIGALLALAIFPFFLAGFWFWNTQVLGTEYHFDLDNYRQWPAELKGPPKLTSESESGIYLYTYRSKVVVDLIKREPQFGSTFIVESNKAFTPVFQYLTAEDLSGTGTRWEFKLKAGANRGLLQLSQLERVSLDVISSRDGSWNLPLYLGSERKLASSDSVVFSRGYTWLLLWIITHIFLVALGEETFYRGYMQRRIEDAITPVNQKKDEKGFLKIGKKTWTAITYTSLFFAIGHVIIPISGTLLIQRISVFFPSLLFGVLKERTGGLAAPIVFHGLSNMMVIVMAVHYS